MGAGVVGVDTLLAAGGAGSANCVPRLVLEELQKENKRKKCSYYPLKHVNQYFHMSTVLIILSSITEGSDIQKMKTYSKLKQFTSANIDIISKF